MDFMKRKLEEKKMKYKKLKDNMNDHLLRFKRELNVTIFNINVVEPHDEYDLFWFENDIWHFNIWPQLQSGNPKIPIHGIIRFPHDFPNSSPSIEIWTELTNSRNGKDFEHNHIEIFSSPDFLWQRVYVPSLRNWDANSSSMVSVLKEMSEMFDTDVWCDEEWFGTESYFECGLIDNVSYDPYKCNICKHNKKNSVPINPNNNHRELELIDRNECISRYLLNMETNYSYFFSISHRYTPGSFEYHSVKQFANIYDTIDSIDSISSNNSNNNNENNEILNLPCIYYEIKILRLHRMRVGWIASGQECFTIGNTSLQDRWEFCENDIVVCVAHLLDKQFLFYVNGKKVHTADMPKNFFQDNCIENKPKQLIPSISLLDCELEVNYGSCSVKIDELENDYLAFSYVDALFLQDILKYDFLTPLLGRDIASIVKGYLIEC